MSQITTITQQKIIEFNTKVFSIYDKLQFSNKLSDTFDVYSFLKVLDMVNNNSSNDEYIIQIDYQNLQDMLHIAPKLDQKYKTNIYLNQKEYSLLPRFESKMTNFCMEESKHNKKPTDSLNIVWIKSSFDDLDFDFYIKPKMSLFITLETKYECTKKLLYPFDCLYTKLRPFHINKKDFIKVPTATNNIETIVDQFYFKDIKSLIVCLRYKNDDNKMLIVMPDIPHTKTELLEIIREKLDGGILNHIVSNLKPHTYSRLYMPILDEIYRGWEIYGNSDESRNINTNNIHVSVLRIPDTNFSNILTYNNEKTIKGIKIINIMNCFDDRCRDHETCVNCGIEDEEYHDFQCCRCDKYDNSSDIHDEHALYLNKCFIYFILNEKNLIGKIGIYNGK